MKGIMHPPKRMANDTGNMIRQSSSTEKLKDPLPRVEACIIRKVPLVSPWRAQETPVLISTVKLLLMILLPLALGLGSDYLFARIRGRRARRGGQDTGDL